MAHRAAMEELEQMRSTMEKMEEERAEMIAEVEAQIERALVHMAVDVDVDADDSDYGGSRPSSRMSSRSAPSTYRRPSDSRSRPLRSFSTESTLAESFANGDDMVKTERVTNTVVEEEEPEEDEATKEKRKKRFSALEVDAHDGMNAVDEGISQKSDKIAQKVLQIQRKVSVSLLSELGWNVAHGTLRSSSPPSLPMRSVVRSTAPPARVSYPSPRTGALVVPSRPAGRVGASLTPLLAPAPAARRLSVAAVRRRRLRLPLRAIPKRKSRKRSPRARKS